MNTADINPLTLPSLLIRQFRSVLNGTKPRLSRPSPRITMTVSEEVYEFLCEWAEREERPLANLAAYLLNQAARERQEQEQQKAPPLWY